MKKNRIKKRWRFIIAIVFSVLFAEFAFAGLSVDPVTLEIVAPKGEEKIGAFKIKNTGADAIKIRVSPEKWGGSDIDINSWMVLQPIEFELLPEETKEVGYKIMPPIYSSGELKCMVFFVADVIGQVKSAVGIRFGVPIYAIVGSTEKIDVKVSGVTVSYNYSEKLIDGTILVANKSNIHVRPKIKIDIYNAKNKLITNFDLPYGQPAQAEQVRSFTFQQPLVLNAGKYKMNVQLDYGALYGLTGAIAVSKKAFVIKVPRI